MVVYVLMLVVLNSYPDFRVHVTPVHTYATLQECKTAVQSVGHEMRLAYPADMGIALACERGVVEQPPPEEKKTLS